MKFNRLTTHGFSVKHQLKHLFLQKYERYLPTAFDSSDSLLEKMNKLIQSQNKLIDIINDHREYTNDQLFKAFEIIDTNLQGTLEEFRDELTDTRDQFETLKEFVENSQLPETVEEKLETWLLDGTLENLLTETVFPDWVERLYTVENKVNDLSVSLKDFGAVGDGVTNDSAPLREALQYLSDSGGGRLVVPEGVYYTTGGMQVTSNITIEGYGKKSVFKRDNHSMMFAINGSTSNEVALTQNSSLGDHFVTVANTGAFSENDYIKVISQRNALSIEDSTDDYYLGKATNSASANPHRLHFGEIRKISAIGSGNGRLFFRGGLIFPDYLTHNNNEVDWSTRRNSTVVKVNFVEDVVFKNLCFDGDFSNVMRFDTAKNCVVDNCHWVNAYEQSFVTFHNSYMCEARNSRVDYTANYTPTADNTRNPFKTVSSVNCGFDNVEVLQGTQCVDFTYSTDSQGIPNQNSYLVNSRMVSPIYDGVTIHPGTINAQVLDNKFINCHADGVFNRSKKALIKGNVITGSQGLEDEGSSYGVKVSHDSMQGTVVSNNNIEGFKVGVGVRDNVNTEVRKVNLLITGNSISRINVGVQLRRNPGSNFIGDSNVHVMGNLFTNFVGPYAKGMDIFDHYFNIFVENNIFEFSDDVNGGIYTRGNASKIFVNNNFFTGYTNIRTILWFGDIDDTIPSNRFQFEGNKFDGTRVLFDTMRTGNLNNGFSNNFYSNLLPNQNNTHSLGTPSFRWRYLYTQNSPDVFSDERLKDNIKPESLGLDLVKQLNPVSYTFKDSDDGVKHGLIAQEVEKLLKDGSIVRKPDEEDEHYSMQYEQFIPIIIKAIQELDDKIK